MDIKGNPLPGAKIEVIGYHGKSSSAEMGDFWRFLLPGKYEVKVSADGYYSYTKVLLCIIT